MRRENHSVCDKKEKPGANKEKEKKEAQKTPEKEETDRQKTACPKGKTADRSGEKTREKKASEKQIVFRVKEEFYINGWL